MKKFFVALAAVAIVATSLVPAQAVEVEGDAYVGIFDKYLWRGFDLSGGQPVMQGGVDLSAYGFTVSYWSNMQLETDEGFGAEGGEITETDIVIDYSFDVNDLVSVSVGNIYYSLDFEGTEFDADTNELYLSVGLATLLEPSLTVYYDYDKSDEDGLFYQLAIGHGIDLSDSLSVGLGAAISYNQESDFAVGDYSDWHNVELSVGADYAVNDYFTVSPSFLYSEPISDDAEDLAGIDDEIVAGLTATFAF